MIKEQPSGSVLFVGMLGIAVCACGGSKGESGDTGGETLTGGAESIATGGAPGDGGSVSGGSDTGGIATGGVPEGETGGVAADTGGSATGGVAADTGGVGASIPIGGSDTGGVAADTGGVDASMGGGAGVSDSGGVGAEAGSGGSTSTGGSGGAFTGTCTESVPTGRSASGSGPHEVIVETNADPGINEGTIFRPADLGGDEKYPIFVWGEGGCSQDGLSNATAMAEIASYGYFVVADGTPNGTGNRGMDRSNMEAMGAPLIAYIDWAIAENEKPCSAYYQSLDTAMVASNGFSCGGLMSQATVPDARIVTWGVTSSGMAGADQAFYEPIHTPVLFVEGGPSDTAYDGGREGYGTISTLDVPVLWFSKDIGHGGDLFQPDGGDFTRINLAWLNWWLKGDESATGKGMLVGPDCPYCSDSSWEVMSAGVP